MDHCGHGPRKTILALFLFLSFSRIPWFSSLLERWHCILAFIPDGGFVFRVSASSLWYGGWLPSPKHCWGVYDNSVFTSFPNLDVVGLLIPFFFRSLQHSVPLPVHKERRATNGFRRSMLLPPRYAALPHPSCPSSLLLFPLIGTHFSIFSLPPLSSFI